MLAVLLVALALSPCLVFSYNVDTSVPGVFANPDSIKSDYFGYSVSLSSEEGHTPFLFIGAPNSTGGIGKVYRCDARDQQSSSCQPLLHKDHPDEHSRDPRWLGGSMASGENSEFMVCAPQTLVLPEYSPRFQHEVKFMHGACYAAPRESTTLTHLKEPNNFENNNFSVVEGFSVDYSRKFGWQQVTHVIGQPGVNNVHIQTRDADGPNLWDDANGLEQLGYSVSSGRYFCGRRLRYAAGAPAWSRTGRVMIFGPISKTKSNEIRLDGSTLGEYFGASLATGDFNGDGCDDLAVGAPHYGKRDSGRVYTYHGHESETLTKVGTLEGKAANGLFGYTLASADLNRDNFSDLVVSAPWEDSGVVYIYYGSSDFGTKDSSGQIMQTIKPSEFIPKYPIQRFGFSLSRPADIDGNGYEDLAIGAYKSGHVVVLYSRTVITTNIELFALPNLLEKTDEKFILSVCLKYEGPDVPTTQDMSFNVTVDKKYNRAVDGPFMQFNDSFMSNQRKCVDRTIFLNTNKILSVPQEKEIPSIVIEVTHDLKKGVIENKLTPVLNRANLNAIKSYTLSFNTGCRDAPVCHANLTVGSSFSHAGPDRTWVVGSGDVNLTLTVTNYGEPALQTRVTVEMPPRVQLRRMVEECKESRTGDTVTLSCEVTDPIRKGSPKTIDICLNMQNVVVTSAKETLYFRVRALSKDDDQKQDLDPRQLDTKSLVNVSFTGATDKEEMEYDWSRDKAKVSIQHSYQVLRSGPSPIHSAYLTVKVPTSMKGGNYSFLKINDPKLIDGYGTTYDCTISDNDTDSGGTPARVSREVSDDGDEKAVIDEIEKVQRTIYLNCSTEGVECKFVKCHFSLKRPQNDVANMRLDMTLDTGVFNTSDEKPPTIEFHTTAVLTVDGQTFFDFKPPASANVSTTLNHAVNMEPGAMAKWILPCSIIFGILLLCLLAFILYKAGFFKRSKKLEAAKAAKDPELTLHVEDDTDVTGERTSLHAN